MQSLGLDDREYKQNVCSVQSMGLDDREYKQDVQYRTWVYMTENTSRMFSAEHGPR